MAQPYELTPNEREQLDAILKVIHGRGLLDLIEWARERLTERGADENLPVRSTSNVMGGDACIRKTRIPVWTLVAYKKAGRSDAEILSFYPGLNAADLIAAWDYYAANAEAVDEERRRHEEID